MSDQDLLGVIKGLAQEFHYQPAVEQEESLQDLLDQCCQHSGGFSPDVSKALLTLVLSVVSPRCQERRELQWQCLGLISRVGRALGGEDEDTAIMEFLFKLAKKEVKAQRLLKPRLLVPLLQQLLCWVKSTDVSRLPGEGDALTSLMGALYAEMSRCDRWPARWRIKTQNALAKLLLALPKNVLEHGLGYLKKEDPPAMLVAPLTLACAALPDAPHRVALVDLYVKQVAEAKQPLSEFALESWRPVVASITAEELEKQVLPAAMRFSKRQPGAVAQSLPRLAAQVSVDLAPHAKGILDPFAIELLKTQDRRAQGRALVEEVALHCNDSASAVAVAEAWAEALKKAGKADEKQALLMGIAAVVNSLPKRSEVETAGKTDSTEALLRLADPKGPVAKAAAEDPAEETRVLGCKALEAVLPKVAPSSAEPVAQELLKSIADKKASDRVKVAALAGLLRTLQKAEAAEQAPWSTLAAEKTVSSLIVAATKPAQRLQSLLAWAIFGGGSLLMPEKLDGQLKKEHLACLKDSASFLNSEALLLKAPMAELASQAQMWCPLLRGSLGGLPSPQLEPSGAAMALPASKFADLPVFGRTAVILLVALHRAVPEKSADQIGAAPGRRPDKDEKDPSPLQRLGLLDTVSKATEANANGLLLLLVQSFASWLAELNAMPRKDLPVTPASLRNALMDLCCATAAAASGGKQLLRPEVLAWLMLLAHHPLLETRVWPTVRLWRWMTEKSPLKPALRSAAAPAWRLLLREVVPAAAANLPASEKTGYRTACISLVKSADLDAPMANSQHASLQSDLDALTKQLLVSLKSEDVGRESKLNVAIFFHPEGSLFAEEGEYMAEEKGEDIQEKSLAKNKYLKGLDDDGGALPVEAPKAGSATAKSKAKAKGKPEAKGKADAKGKAAPKAANKGHMTAEDIKNVRIQEQSEIRARIRTYVDEADFALDVIIAVASHEAHAEVVEKVVTDLTTKLLVLLESPLTTMHARRAARACVNILVPTALVPRRDLLPEALQVVAKSWFQRSAAAAGTPGDLPACQVVLERVSTTTVIPPVAFNLVAPVVLRPLLHSGLSIERVCARALEVLDKQLLLGATVPEAMLPELFESLGTVLLTVPTERPATQAALQAVCKMLVSTEEQLAKLSDMFFSEEDVVRSAVIVALAELSSNENYLNDSLSAEPCHAVLRLGALENETAKATIEDLGLEPGGEVLLDLIRLCRREPPLGPSLQDLVAQAVSAVATEVEDPEETEVALDALMQYFREGGGASRVAVAKCMDRIFANNLEDERHIAKAFKFLLQEALGITNSGTPESIQQRDLLLSAGINLIKKQGQNHADKLFNIISEFEDSAQCKIAGESANLGVAVFLGGLSEHLGADNPKVPEIPPRLLQRLLDPTSTTSVQDAIVKVMPPLMKQNKEQADETLVQLLDKALTAKIDDITRRGAAMGLGATVKGLSSQAINKHGILDRIKTAAENKKETGTRVGALLCLEGLTVSLGRLFDPYVVLTLPLLLQAFSDPVRTVQQASKSAASAMMSQLSGPGVKQVLKPLLEGIQDKQWRTKMGSIELLAAMSSCLPKQLAQCLPQVVPALCTVINDQHAKVKETAREALDKIGSIITSPELKTLAPELIEALTDGGQYEHITKRMLDQLLATSFVHRIDAPSLSLVCPLVQRALKDRGAEMKRKGAQIVGSMVLLIKDPKDIQPYLPLLLPQLKETLIDANPDVRSTAAKAFGTLAHCLPEDMLGDVLPWLFGMLRSTESAVERSGAAHGLSEVLMAMGTERIEKLLPDILSNASNQEAAAEVKEGYIGLFVYLPGAMKSEFVPHIHTVLTAELQAISDDATEVRDTAYKAAQVLVRQFGATHVTDLLPAIQDGVFGTDWRIRHASVLLMGLLIEQVLRAHKIPANSAELIQVDVLPKELRCDMLSSLYIVRSDENVTVRQAVTQVWKAVVQNTPRTLKELLPSLMRRLLASLASDNREKQRVAARCVGDLVGKLGERVMPELMPIFMDTLAEGTDQAREGVCIGLAELINATTKQLLAEYLRDLIPAIRKAIIDEEEHVRNAASEVVALLHKEVGAVATREIVTWVLDQLEGAEDDDDAQLYLAGLEQLMEKQHVVVLPLMLEKLSEPSDEGWTASQVQGLATLAVVPDSHTIHVNLSEVMPSLIEVAHSAETEELRECALDSAVRVMERVEQAGLTNLCLELSGALQDTDSAGKRVAGAQLLERFVVNTELDLVEALPQVLPAVLPVALADEEEEALSAGIKALTAIVGKCKKEELAQYLQTVRDQVLALVMHPITQREDMSKLLPGLCRPKECGLEPLYPIYQNVLINGSPEMRELAAKALGELVNHTTPEALKPFVVKITGPLIRIVGDRFPANVKKAILDTLKSLLIKGGVTQRPFWPQLLTTYVKCLHDPTEAVRLKAGESLGTLVKVAQRTENLIIELSNSMISDEDEAVRQSMCIALGEVLLNVPQLANDQAKADQLKAKLQEGLTMLAFEGDVPPSQKEAAATALAWLIRRHLPEEEGLALLQGEVKTALEGSPGSRRSAARVLAGACWVQEQLPPLSDSLRKCLDTLTGSWLPKLVGGNDVSLQVAGAPLLASVARLTAEASPANWDPLKQQAETLATLLSKQLTGQDAVLVIQALKHYLSAAKKAKKSLFTEAAGSAVASAVAGRQAEAPDAAAQAIAILLALPAGCDKDAVTTSPDRLTGANVAATADLRSYTGGHWKELICVAEADMEWDF